MSAYVHRDLVSVELLIVEGGAGRGPHLNYDTFQVSMDTFVSRVEKIFSSSLNEHPKGDTYERLAYRLFFQNIIGFAWLKPAHSEYFTHLCQKKA